MSSSRKLLSALALVLLVLQVLAEDSSSSRSDGSGNISALVLLVLLVLTAWGLLGGNRDVQTRLHSSHVSKAERVRRPLNSSASGVSAPFVSPIMGAIAPHHDPSTHSGVKVTLEDGSEWLIHKEKGYGKENQTVVTDARNMGPEWTNDGLTRDFDGSQTVSDLIRAGGPDYDLLRDNCHHAADRIMNLE